MAKKKSSSDELRQLQAWIDKMRTTIKGSQQELDKVDKAAKKMKKMFEQANEKLAKTDKKRA
jgi:septal ring factor EnvC (AmiA/AmiB activator)